MPLSKIALISHPKMLMGETDTLFKLFELGLNQLHLRKENFTEELYLNYLNRFPKKYRDRLILHEYPKAANKYELLGCHFKSDQTPEKRGNLITGASIHSVKELEQKEADYYYLSPIFESISKPGHKSDLLQQLKDGKISIPADKKVFALGGINPENISELNGLGFHGVVALGFIWEQIHTFKIVDNFKRLQDEVEKYF